MHSWMSSMSENLHVICQTIPDECCACHTLSHLSYPRFQAGIHPKRNQDGFPITTVGNDGDGDGLPIKDVGDDGAGERFTIYGRWMDAQKAG